MEIELSDKVKYLIKLVIVTVTVYFSLKYLLPLFLPLLAAYVIAHLLKPITIIVCKKWKIKKQITAVILLVVVVGIVGIAMAFIMNRITGQVKNKRLPR